MIKFISLGIEYIYAGLLYYKWDLRRVNEAESSLGGHGFPHVWLIAKDCYCLLVINLLCAMEHFFNKFKTIYSKLIQLWIQSNETLAHIHDEEKLIDKLNSPCTEQQRTMLLWRWFFSVDMNNSILAAKIATFSYKILLLWLLKIIHLKSPKIAISYDWTVHWLQTLQWGIFFKTS